MRIGFIIYGTLDALSGGYLYDRIVVQGLTRLGHQVEVISLPSGSYLRRLGQGFSIRLGRRLLAGGFDVLIEDELCHPSLFLVNSWLRRRAGPPLVALVHHLLCQEPRPGLINRLLAVAERRYLASVHGFIHNSETTRRNVASLVEHNRPQIVASPAGDRLGTPLGGDVIAKRALTGGPLQLLFVGNVIPRKGLLPLLEALAWVAPDRWRLSVVGGLEVDAAQTARARQLVRRYGLVESVRFLGPLPDGQLVALLRASHIFCMPYAYEGFGIAILEAMAFGLPALGSCQGAAGEIIRHGSNGFLLAPGDHGALATLIAELHQDRLGLQKRALAALATYNGRPGWQEGVTAIEGFLRQLQAGATAASHPPTPAPQNAAGPRAAADFIKNSRGTESGG
ncbi:MAG: glycosyltransferase family 4 protein [Desulfurivibrionaceae bacterium]|nr:glycosyltransferase family 4 protein [Desulfurivibrionaceae bacterium]